MVQVSSKTGQHLQTEAYLFAVHPCEQAGSSSGGIERIKRQTEQVYVRLMEQTRRIHPGMGLRTMYDMAARMALAEMLLLF